MGSFSLVDPALYTNEADPPLHTNFAVQIDAIPSVQMWTKVSGLKMTIAQQSGSSGRAAKGSHGSGQQRPAKQTQTLTLTRPLGPASQSVYGWCQKATQATSKTSGTSGVVLLIDRASLMVYEWELGGIIPQSWSIADFDASAGSGNVVIETLTVQYNSMKFTVSVLDT